jgi:hypothetical protein
MPAVHCRHDVVERLSGRLDAWLNARREVHIRKATRSLQFADGVGGGSAEGGTFPQLGRQQEDSTLCRRQADLREPVGVLAYAVARGGGVFRAEILRIRQSLNLKAKLPKIHLVAFEHAPESDVILSGIPVNLFAQDGAGKPHPGIEQGQEKVQESFSAGCGHGCYVTKDQQESSKARHQPVKPEGDAPWAMVVS